MSGMNIRRAAVPVMLILAIALALSGCGGGGGAAVATGPGGGIASGEAVSAVRMSANGGAVVVVYDLGVGAASKSAMVERILPGRVSDPDRPVGAGVSASSGGRPPEKAAGAVYSVKLLYSHGGGAFVPAAKVDGDTGEVAAGREKAAVWDALAELPEGATRVRVRLEARAAGNAAGGGSASGSGGEGGAPAGTFESAPFEMLRGAAAGAPAYFAGKVAFTVTRGGKFRTMLANSDGGGLTALTDGAANEIYPGLSAGGDMVAFVSDRDGTAEVFVAGVDGRGMKAVTRALSAGGYNYSRPAFSPDGRRVCFAASWASASALAVAGAGTTIMEAVVATGAARSVAGPFAYADQPSYSPDGSRVVFHAREGAAGTTEIYAADARGGAASNGGEGAAVRLFSDGRANSCAVYSPDGMRVAYASSETGADADMEIWERDNASGEAWRITRNATADRDPCYSPDGTRIVFSGADGAARGVFSVAAGRPPANGGVTAMQAPVKIAGAELGGAITPSCGGGAIIVAPPARTPAKLSVSGARVRGRTVDLGSVECTLVYSDLSEAKVSPAWSVVEGAGTIADNFYRSPAGETRAVLTAAYSEGGTAVTASVAVDLSGADGAAGGRIFHSAHDGLSFRVHSMDAAGGGAAKLSADPFSALCDISFSADGAAAVFTAYAGGRLAIFSMNCMTLEKTRLTSGAQDDLEPAFSPDRSRIAFVSRRDGNAEIYTMDAAGGGVKKLTDSAADDTYPSWSPDGAKIVFTSRRDGYMAIYEMGADGSGVKKLSGGAGYDDAYARYAGADRIVFQSSREGVFKIYSMAADGSGAARVTSGDGEDWYPAPSPDGSSVAFVSNRSGSWEIWASGADGSGAARVTDNAFTDDSPVFTADGRNLVYLSGPGTDEFYGTGLADGRVFKYIRCCSNDLGPVTYAGGTKLLFQSDRDSMTFYLAGGQEYTLYNIFQMDAAGGGTVRRVTMNNPFQSSWSPAVSPDGTLAAYYFEDAAAAPGARSIVAMASAASGAGSPGSGGAISQSALSGEAAKKGSGFGLAVSPGGEIFFSSNISGSYDIWKAAPGGREERVTKTAGDEFYPALGTSGALAFSANASGSFDIYSKSASGEPLRLTAGSGDESVPAWSPDGARIAYRFSEGSAKGIAVMRADGSGATRIATGAVSPGSWGE